MIKDFFTSVKLKNTYRMNTFIYALKSLPVIKKLLPESLYASQGLKSFAGLVTGLYNFAELFVGKIIYILLMFVTFTSATGKTSPDVSINIITFLTIIGAMLNTYMFDPSKDKYYAICLMRMNAKNYAVSNYIASLVKAFIGFLPVILVYGVINEINIGICILIPCYIVSAKIISAAISLKKYEINGKIKSEMSNDKFSWILLIICLALAYGLPIANIMITSNIFIAISIISMILAIVGMIYIFKFDKYQIVYKKILTNPVETQAELTGSEAQKEASKKIITFDEKIESNKTGYEYFNDLFMKRHKKLLNRSSLIIAAIALIIFIVLNVIGIFNEDIKGQMNNFVLQFLPYFTFIMYMINRGQRISQTMFMNCDSSMLTYACYKDPKSILKLFVIRLKSIIKTNLLPAFVIAIGLPITLYITGGTDNIYNYIVLFISIISMSVFFSIHHLVMYYLLQPYNVNSEMKNSTYTIANVLTYAICYTFLKVQIPIILFGLAMIGFAIIYSIVALFLVYKYAPKTFKLRV